MSQWYLLVDGPDDAANNMAIDEYLFQYCHMQKCGFFRIYQWRKPSFSFGVSQKNERAINAEYIRSHDCQYVRRITGGKTVLHDNEITYAVVSSEEIFYTDHDLYQSYLLISQILVNALRLLELNAYLSAGSTPELSRSNNPCFSFPTPNEIEIAGKKIIGSAQKRDKFALLQHGSIPFTMNYELYASGANSQAELIRSSMTTIDALATISKDNLTAALITSFKDFVHAPFASFPIQDREHQAGIATLIDKYSSDAWNFIR